MKILIAFATYSGSTQSAVDAVAAKLTELQHTAEIKNIQEISVDDLNAYDLIVFATPSWSYEGKDGQPHVHFMEFIEKAKGKTFPDKNFAILGLGDSSYPHFCGAVEVLQAFVGQLQGKQVGEPLKIDGFFFNQDENTRLVSEWAEKLVTPSPPSI